MAVSKENLDLENSTSIIDEDYEVVKKAQNGDIMAQNMIINKYKPMVISKSKTYFLIGADRDDIIQEGLIGLYKSIRDYNCNKSSSFKHFADICVTRQMITAVKAATRQKHKPLNTYISLNRPIYEDDSEKTYFETYIDEIETDPEKLIIGKEDFKNIEKKIEEILSKFEKDVFMLYINGFSYNTISKILNKDSKSIDNAIQRVKRKLEKSLENKGE